VRLSALMALSKDGERNLDGGAFLFAEARLAGGTVQENVRYLRCRRPKLGLGDNQETGERIAYCYCVSGWGRAG